MANDTRLLSPTEKKCKQIQSHLTIKFKTFKRVELTELRAPLFRACPCQKTTEFCQGLRAPAALASSSSFLLMSASVRPSNRTHLSTPMSGNVTKDVRLKATPK